MEKILEILLSYKYGEHTENIGYKSMNLAVGVFELRCITKCLVAKVAPRFLNAMMNIAVL